MQNNCNIIAEMPEVPPIAIAIWCGDGKPTNLNDFLRSFVMESDHLITNGLTVNNHLISIHIRCFICDTPARSFIKGVVNNG